MVKNEVNNYFKRYTVRLDNKDKDYIDLQVRKSNFSKVINKYLDSINFECKAKANEFVCGTNHFYYYTVISSILYILDRYCDDEFIFDTLVDLLQNVHLNNLNYEEQHPPVIYKKKQTKKVVEKKARKVYDKEEDTKTRLRQLASLDLSNIKLKIKL